MSSKKHFPSPEWREYSFHIRREQWIRRRRSADIVGDDVETCKAPQDWCLPVGAHEPFNHPNASAMAEYGYSFMSLIDAMIAFAFVTVSLLVIVRVKGQREQRELEQHSITAEELHALLASNQEVLLFDVRLPLDLLANSEIIPKAQRIPPEEVLQKPSLIPRDKDTVVYCTCPSDKTSRAVLRRALGLHFSRIKFLKGGLAAWKARGYAVEPYNEVFHLYPQNVTSLSEFH